MAKGLKTLAALGGLGAAAYLAGKMGKKDGSMEDELEGQDRSTRRGDSSMEDELAGMDRSKAARQAKASKAVGKSMMKKDEPKAATAPAPRKATADSGSAPSALRPGAKAVVESKPGEFDRFMAQRKLEAEKDRLFKEGMRNRSSSVDEGSGGIGEQMVGAKRGGKIQAKKYAGGGSVGSASKRADGCAMRGKTKGRMV